MTKPEYLRHVVDVTPTVRTTNSPASPQHIATLDGLRGVAAIAVLLFHIDEKILNHLISSSYAYLAVDFFFMLSGFVVAKAYEARLLRGLSVASFAAIRLRRLYPMIFLGVILGTVILAMRAIIRRDLEIESILIAAFWAFLLLPWQTKGRPGDLYPVNTPHWSLFFELAINFIYASLVKHLKTGTLAIVCLASLVGLVCVLASGPGLGDLGAKPPTFMLGCLRVIFSFSLGVLLYRLQRLTEFNCKLSPLLLCGLLFVFLMAPWFPRNWYSELLVVGLVFPAFMVAAIRCPNAERTRGVLRMLGELSYPLYATHEPLIRLFLNASQILKWEESAITVGILAFVAAIAFAFASYVFWDRPVREWLQKVYATSGRVRSN